MKNTETKKQNTVAQVIIFGDAFENKELSLKEFIEVMKNKYSKNELTVGKLAYYGLAMRNAGLAKVSYPELVAIIKKIFILNGLTTNTTEKCMASYQKDINKGKIDTTKPYQSSARTVRTNRLDEIEELF